MPAPSSEPLVSSKQPALPIGTPYCSACGYDLSASRETPVCPECGRPLVEVLTRVTASMQMMGRSRRYRSATTVFGLPFIDIAMGPRPEAGERIGRARGFIAIGDTATGVIALGGRAMGIVAVGGLSAGVFSIGGLSVGVAAALGGLGLALGGVGMGGVGAGVIGFGGLAAGVFATGGLGAGYYVRAGTGFGPHVLDAVRKDPGVQPAFDALAWLLPMQGMTPMAFYVNMAVVGGWVAMAALLVFAVGVFLRKEPVGRV